MFCSNCGFELEDGMKFCPKCGAAVSAKVIEVLKEEKAEVPETLETTEEAHGEAVSSAEPMTEEETGIVSDVLETAAEEVKEDVSEAVAVAEGSFNEAAETLESSIESAMETVNEALETAEKETGDVYSEAAAEVREAAEAVSESISEEAPAEPAEGGNVASKLSDFMNKTDVPKAEAMPFPQEPAKKKAGKGKVYGIVAALLIVLGVGGYFIYQNMPSVKYEKAMTAGNEAYEAYELNEALTQFKIAHNAKPDDEAASEMLYKTYAEYAYALILEDQDYEKAIHLLDLASVDVAQYKEDFRKEQAFIYYFRALAMAEEQQFDYASMDATLAVLNEGKTKGLDMEVYEAALQGHYYTRDLYHSLEEEANSLALSYDAGPSREYNTMLYLYDISRKAVDLWYYAENLSITVDDPLVFETEGDFPFVCIMRDDENKEDYDMAVYYGNMVGYKPQGEGVMLLFMDGEDIYKYKNYRAEFEEGLANGEFVETYKEFSTATDALEFEMVTRGSCKEGRLDGKLSFTLNGDVFYAEYSDGEAKILNNESIDGETVYAYAYTEDKKGFLYYHAGEQKREVLPYAWAPLK